MQALCGGFVIFKFSKARNKAGMGVPAFAYGVHIEYVENKSRSSQASSWTSGLYVIYFSFSLSASMVMSSN